MTCRTSCLPNLPSIFPAILQSDADVIAVYKKREILPFSIEDLQV